MKAVAKIIISMLLLLQFCIYTAAQNVGINQLNPQYPLDILAGQGVIRMITTDSSFGSVIELKNINTASQYLGAVNFNDSTNNHPGQIGYLTNHNLTFRTNLGERMRIDHLGRIGIGTAVPQWPIDIRANQGVVGITSTVANFGSGLELRNLNTAADYLGAINFNDSLGSYPGQIGYLSNHNLTFRTGQLERMRINSLGHVGIGTTSPEWPIDVVANNAIARFRSTSVDGSGIILRNMASTPDLLGYLEFQGPSGQPGSWIGGLPNKDLFFVVNNSECVRISAAGRLGVGCSTPVWPIHIKANQGVIGITSTTANLGSGVELQNLNPAAEYIGAINFNDSIGSYPGQIGYLSNHNLTFRTSQLERMRIDPFGRIGIGTTTPEWPIDVSAPQSVLRLTTTSDNFGSGLELRNLNPAAAHIGAINFNDSLGSYPGQIAYHSNHALTFRVSQYERMRINAFGHVGIGTSVPEWPLDISAPQGVLRLSSTTALEPVVELRSMHWEADVLGAIKFSTFFGAPGKIAYRVDDNLTFTTQYQERMRIDPMGRIGIGTLSPLQTIDIEKPVGNIRINSTASDNGSDLELRSNNNGTQFLGSIFFNNSENSYPGRIAYQTDHILSFTVQNQERMRIDPIGRIGIGRIPTDNILEVEGDCYIQSGLGIGMLNPVYPFDMAAEQSVARLTTTTSTYGSGIELKNDVVNPDYLGAINFNNSIGSYPGQIGYSGDNNMTFRVNTLERMRIDAMGRIGIGTISPLQTIDIQKQVANIRINSTASDSGSEIELRSSHGGSQYLGSIFFNNAENGYPGRIGYYRDHILYFTVQNQERMRIDPNGRIGIGRIPTDNILEVEGDCYIQSGLGIGMLNPVYPIDMAADQSVARLTTTTSTFGSGIELRNEVVNPDYLGAINFNNSTGNYPGQIGYSGDNNMTFRVNHLERMRINSSGLTGIGRIPVTNKLEVEGNASKSSAGDWLANSDSRLKKNIKPLQSQQMLEKLLALQGVSFEWNDNKTATVRPEGEHYGFIAQDIQETFPTLVEEDNLGYLQTAYGTYDPMMVEAIRALDEKIRILQEENDKLKKDLADLMNMLSADREVSRER